MFILFGRWCFLKVPKGSKNQGGRIRSKKVEEKSALLRVVLWAVILVTSRRFLHHQSLPNHSSRQYLLSRSLLLHRPTVTSIVTQVNPTGATDRQTKRPIHLNFTNIRGTPMECRTGDQCRLIPATVIRIRLVHTKNTPGLPPKGRRQVWRKRWRLRRQKVALGERTRREKAV